MALMVLLGGGLAACLGSVPRVLAQGGGTTPLAPCPPPDSLGEGTSTPGPDDVSWDYLLECGHCLAMTPTSTSGWALATPTVGVRGFHADCPTDYAVLKGGYAVTTVELYDHVQHPQTYGAIFTVRYATTPLEGYGPPTASQHAFEPRFIPSQYTPLWLRSSPSYFAAFEDGQTYCAVAAGHTDLCAQFAPGAEVRLLDGDGAYIPAPSLSAPLVLPVYLSETVDPFWFEDVRVLYYGEAGPACPVPFDPLDWRVTCPEDVVVAHDGAFTHFEVPVGGAGWDYPTDVYAVLFEVQASGTTVSLALSAVRNYFTTDAIGTALSEGTVCIGDAQVCTRLGPAGPFTIIEHPVVDVSELRTMGFTVTGGAAGTVALRDVRYGVYGDGLWSCEAPTPTPLPTSTPAPTWTPMGTGLWVGAWQRATYTGTDWWAPLWYAFSAGGGGVDNLCGYLFRPVQCDNFKSMSSDLSGDTSQNVDLGGMGCVFAQNNASCGNLALATACAALASGTTNYTPQVGKLPKTVAGVYSLQLQGGAYSGQKTCVADAAPIYYGSARPHPVTPTPTVTVTPTATRTVTPAPTSAAVVPTPDPERCRVYDWKDAYEPAVDVAGDWEGLIEPGDCYEVIPGLSITTPDLGAIGDLLGLDSYTLTWEGFRYCIMWVNFPSVSILGLSLSLEWFLLPAAAWLLNKLAEM